MTQDKDLKRLVRARMKKTGESYTSARAQITRKPKEKTSIAETRATVSTKDYAKLAGMSNAVIKEKTGCTWDKWVKSLDYYGAERMSHREIAELVSEKYKVPSWWTQTVTVGYERIKGLRARGQRRDGTYEATKSRTFNVPIEKLFDAFEKTQKDDLDAKSTLVRRACEELTVHAMIEEELLYPAAQEALEEDDRPDVEEAYVEHFLVKVLIDKFTKLKAGEPGFDATFKVMSEMVRHHIEEEESDLFPKLRKSGADLGALGKKLIQRKEKLEAKIPKDAGDNTMRLH